MEVVTFPRGVMLLANLNLGRVVGGSPEFVCVTLAGHVRLTFVRGSRRLSPSPVLSFSEGVADLTASTDSLSSGFGGWADRYAHRRG